MLIPIPIGAKHVAAVEGTVWKHISCASCHQPFAFLLELQATGEDHDLLFLDGEGSANRAQAQAEKNFFQKSQNIVVPIPCPGCGTYQENMVQLLKDDASINATQVIGGAIALLSPVPLAFGFAYAWILTLALAVIGLSLLAYGFIVALRYDPNAGDPEPRKMLGQKHAIWGEELAELVTSTPTGDSGALPDQGQNRSSHAIQRDKDWESR